MTEQASFTVNLRDTSIGADTPLVEIVVRGLSFHHLPKFTHIGLRSLEDAEALRDALDRFLAFHKPKE